MEIGRNARRETFLALKHEPFSNSACRAFISFEIVAGKCEVNFNQVGPAVPGGSRRGFLMPVARSSDRDCKKPPCPTLFWWPTVRLDVVYRPRVQLVPIDRFIASTWIH